MEVFGDEYEEEVDTGYKPGTLDIPLTIGMIQNILHEISAKQVYIYIDAKTRTPTRPQESVIIPLPATWTTPHAPLLPLFSPFAYILSFHSVLPFHSTISV